MDYCTLQDLENHLSTPTLSQLTSDEGSDIDHVVVEEAVLYATTLINGYLRGRHKLPLSCSFPLLRIIAIDISVYRLYSRRMRTEIPAIIAQQYNDAIKRLQDIQKGVITLESTNENGEEFPVSEYQSGGYRTNKTPSDRIFSKARLSEY